MRKSSFCVVIFGQPVIFIPFADSYNWRGEKAGGEAGEAEAETARELFLERNEQLAQALSKSKGLGLIRPNLDILHLVFFCIFFKQATGTGMSKALTSLDQILPFVFLYFCK